MNEKHRNELIDALEAAFLQSGIDMYSGARRLHAFLEGRLPMVAASRSRESLDHDGRQLELPVNDN